MAIVFDMETSTSPQRVQKKRGPVKRLPPMADTHVHLPPDLLEWAKEQPGGLAPLMRELLTAERARRSLSSS